MVRWTADSSDEGVRSERGGVQTPLFSLVQQLTPRTATYTTYGNIHLVRRRTPCTTTLSVCCAFTEIF